MSVRRKLSFADIGKSVDCPKCHVAFKLHLGHLFTEYFPCGRCKAYLSFECSPVRIGPCSCCHGSRLRPNNLNYFVCGGCDAFLLHQIYDRTVKCHRCKHITPNVENYGIPFKWRTPIENQVLVPRVYRQTATTPEIESTLSSFFTPKPKVYIVQYPDDAVSETVGTSNREIEEEKTEETAESKMIRL